MKKTLLLLLALLFTTLPVLAQDFGSVSGLVTLGDRPVQGAVITLTPVGNNNGGGRPIVMQTNVEGRYSFQAVTAGRAMIVAQLPENGASQNRNIEIIALQNTEVNFAFEIQNEDEFGAVHGMVSANNEPVVGAVVILMPPDPNGGGERYTTQTGRDGRYRFDEIVAGRYTAMAQALNGDVQQRDVEVAVGQDVEVNFAFDGGNNQDEFGVVHGHVFADNQPIVGAEVTLTARVNDNNGRVYSTETGRDGTYRIEQVVAGVYLAHAENADGNAQEQVIQVAANQDLEVNFELQGGNGQDEVGVVFGMVSAIGEPVVGASVALMPPDPNGAGHRYETVTGRDGTYRFAEVVVGRYLAVAQAPNAGIDQHNIEVAADQELEVNFDLQDNNNQDEFGVVHGHVFANNQAVIGATVTLTARDPNNNGNQMYQTQTGRDGTYLIEDVVVGIYLAHAQGADGGTQDRVIEVVANQNLEVNFELQGGNEQDEFGVVFGMVSANNEAVVGASVTLMPRDQNHGGNRMYQTQTGRDGTYRFAEVIPGLYTARAVAPNGVVQEHAIEVAANEELEVNFELQDVQEHHFGVVFGTVSANDEPVADATVFLIPRDPMNGENIMYSMHTNQHGMYRIENVLAGQYLARAQGPAGGVQEQIVEVADNEEIEVNFVLQGDNGGDDQVVGSITGTVSDPDGAAIDHAEVVVTGRVRGGGNDNGGMREVHFSTRTDAHGHFTFEHVPVGVVGITAGKASFEPYAGQLEVVENEAVNIDIILQPVAEGDHPMGSIHGTVRDTDGQAISLAHVMLVPQGNRGDNGFHDPNDGMRGRIVAFTDEQGDYAFDGVPVGVYLARAAKRLYLPSDQQVAVAEGEATEANFTLDADTLQHHGGNGDHNGGENPHQGERVDLQGTAIVIEGDVANVYLLDIDADGAADYLLNFGPQDYDPGNGATRPENGDEIEVTGMIAGHMEPTMVLIFTIDGQEWRNPNNGDHGGREGGGNGWDHAIGNLELVEAEGTVILGGEDAAWFHRYGLNIDDNPHPEYLLFFGEDDYDPGNGAQRPADGDFVNIVGGLVQRDNGVPVIVVYQIDGQLWREPGDTAQLEWIEPDGIENGGNNAPATPVLLSSYPNPFNPKATVDFSIAEGGKVKVSLLDLMGRQVAIIAQGNYEAGSHTLTLDASNLKAGTYFLRLESSQGGLVQKVTLLR